MSKKLSYILGSFFRNNDNSDQNEEAVRPSDTASEEDRQQHRKDVLKAERKVERAAAASRRALTASPEVTVDSILRGSSVISDEPAPGDAEGDAGLLSLLREEIGEEYIPDTHITRGEFSFFRKRFGESRDADGTAGSFVRMYVDWLFFCKDLGYDMDDYFDFEFYGKSPEERLSFVSATFRENMKRALNPEPQILMRKAVFLDTFSGFIKRDWLDCSKCSIDEFRAFAERNPVFFCKAEKGFGAEGLQKLSPSADEIDSLYADCAEKRCVLEEPIRQHEALQKFNPDTVNSIRLVTIADASDRIVIPSAAMRFGRVGSFADNYHQGGLCAKVDPENGTITGDAIDRTGKHWPAHPDSGIVFDGYSIPCWDKICAEASAAALSCIESDRFIGWDLTLTEDGEVDFIEGNSRPGFAILQSPDMKGIKEEYIKTLSGLISEEELLDTRKGYWRKWKLDI